MVEISPEIQIRSTIKEGSVYYFSDNELNSKEPHYFIVLNHNPKNEEILLLVCSTTKINERKKIRKLFKNTLVEISKRDYSDFKYDSIIDCNIIFPRTIEEIISKLKSDDLKIKKEMDSAIIEKLREAVCQSPVIEQCYIEMLLT